MTAKGVGPDSAAGARRRSDRGPPIVIRPYVESDLPGVSRLLTAAMGAGPGGDWQSYWTWKHTRCPFGPSPVLLAVAPTGEPVGVRAFLRWRWRAGEQEVQSVRAVDTATHPDWQGRGIFSLLTRRLLDQLPQDGVPFVFNTPNAKSLPGYLKLGWVEVGRHSLWIKAKASPRTLRALLTRRTDAEAEEPSDCSSPAPGQLADVLRSQALDPLLAGRRYPAGRFRTPLSREYVRWRYLDTPGASYNAVLSPGPVDTSASLIYRPRRRAGLRELLITELLLSPRLGSLRRATALLMALAAEGLHDYLLAVAPLRSLEALALTGAGFLPVPRAGLRLVVRHVPGAPPPPVAPDSLSSWHISAGDVELL